MKNMEKVKTDAFELEGVHHPVCNYHLEEATLVYLTLDCARALANLVGYYKCRESISSSDSGK